MSKPKIYATGNENIPKDSNVSYYIIEKDEKFLIWLERLLREILELDDSHNTAKFVEDNYEKIIYTKDIKNMTDIHEKYENKGDRVDVFYGKNRVYMTFRKSKETRKKFARFVYKTKSWIQVKKADRKQIPVYFNELK
jgi:hypothetical protein